MVVFKVWMIGMGVVLFSIAFVQVSWWAFVQCFAAFDRWIQD